MNIIGHGVDIIEIERVAAAIKRRPELLNRLFHPSEQDYFAQRKYQPSTIAGCFAAKEAVVKALGTGFSGVRPSDVRLCWDETGKPSAQVDRYPHIRFELSISHSKRDAIASAIAIAEIEIEET